ncbi:MAG TPA: carboxymuconolactone decarboxylase family protein [Iamia sp.]|nr:carboxymuconolactone decarboxylase family protein [Iamia sp.]
MADTAAATAREGITMLTVEEARAVGDRHGVTGWYVEQPVWRVYLGRPKYAKALYDVLTDLRFRTCLDARSFELVVMRLAWRRGSAFEWAQHWRIAVEAGVPAEHLAALRDPREGAAVFDERDHALLDAVDEIDGTGDVTDATWARLVDHLTEPELYELVAVVGTYTLVDVMTRCLRVPIDEGLALWPPDGRTPPA